MWRKNKEADKPFRELINREYNEEPICFCKRCLSPRIIHENDESTDFCDDCGSTSIIEANVFEWEKLYKETYGDIYLDIKK